MYGVSRDGPSFVAQAVTDEQMRELLERARKDFRSQDKTTIDEWIHGSEEKDIPPFAGYALGYYLVGEYLRAHPDKKLSDLSAVPAEEFIEPPSETPRS